MDLILTIWVVISVFFSIFFLAVLYGLMMRLEKVRGFEAVRTSSAGISVIIFILISVLSLILSVGIKWGR